MSTQMPAVPAGNGQHPIPLIVISAGDMAASSAFYATVFGWQMHPISPDLTAVVAPSGPTISLHAGEVSGAQGVIPFIAVADVDAGLARAVAAGANIERAPWSMPMVGTLARFTDASGTVYGLTSAVAPEGLPHVPMPLGDGPKPPPNSICSLEMYASDGGAAARFFGDLFGWGSAATMAHYMAFDAGAGIGGVFQSHTPAMPAVAYVFSDDVAACLGTIVAAGGQQLGDAMSMPGVGTFGYFVDPSGTHMGLIGP